MIYWHAFLANLHAGLVQIAIGAGWVAAVLLGFFIGRYQARHNELDKVAAAKVAELKTMLKHTEDLLADSRAECAGLKFALATIKGAWSKVQRLLGSTLELGSAIGECTPVIEVEAKSRRAAG